MIFIILYVVFTICTGGVWGYTINLIATNTNMRKTCFLVGLSISFAIVLAFATIAIIYSIIY